MSNITIPGGAGAIGLVHAFMLVLDGHTVTILDSRPDGAPGDSFVKLSKAAKLYFSFPEIDELKEKLNKDGISKEKFQHEFALFPRVFITRLNDILSKFSNDQFSHADCLEIIEQMCSLPIDGKKLRLAQASSEINEPQDIIAITVKGAALNRALGEKIQAIPQKPSTPVIIFVNGAMPWLVSDDCPELKSLAEMYPFMRTVGIAKLKAGVLIKYGAAITAPGAVIVRSKFFDTKNVIGNITDVGVNEDLRDLTTIYTKAGLNTSPAESKQALVHQILSKLTYNLTGSMMGAIFNKKLGELLEHPMSRAAVLACGREYYQLCLTMSVELAPSETEFLIGVEKALLANASVVSSPLQDVMLRRPTEKGFLLSPLRDLAVIYGKDVPVLQAMFDLISSIEAQYGAGPDAPKVVQNELWQQLDFEYGDRLPAIQALLTQDAPEKTNKLQNMSKDSDKLQNLWIFSHKIHLAQQCIEVKRTLTY